MVFWVGFLLAWCSGVVVKVWWFGVLGWNWGSVGGWLWCGWGVVVVGILVQVCGCVGGDFSPGVLSVEVG